MASNHRPDRGGRGVRTEAGQCLRRAALDGRRGIVEGVDQHVHRARVADQAEAERRHLAHLRLRVRQQPDQRVDAFREPDAPDGQRRTAAQVRFRRLEQARQIRARRCGAGRRPR